MSFDFLAKASPVDLEPRAASADGQPVVAFAVGEVTAARLPSAEETPFVAVLHGADLAAWAKRSPGCSKSLVHFLHGRHIAISVDVFIPRELIKLCEYGGNAET